MKWKLTVCSFVTVWGLPGWIDCTCKYTRGHRWPCSASPSLMVFPKTVKHTCTWVPLESIHWYLWKVWLKVCPCVHTKLLNLEKAILGFAMLAWFMKVIDFNRQGSILRRWLSGKSGEVNLEVVVNRIIKKPVLFFSGMVNGTCRLWVHLVTSRPRLVLVALCFADAPPLGRKQLSFPAVSLGTTIFGKLFSHSPSWLRMRKWPLICAFARCWIKLQAMTPCLSSQGHKPKERTGGQILKWTSIITFISRFTTSCRLT